MTRPVRVVGAATAALLAICAVIWTLALRTPPTDRLPLPASLVSAESDAGAHLPAEGRFTADYDALTRSFEAQSRAAYCGVASSVIVLNALRGGVAPFTQSTVFPDASTELRTTFGGMTLAQLGDLLRANGVRATATYASDSSLDAFRTIARLNLETPRDFVLVNYERAALGQSKSGHISPLAAYDADTDRLLILDVASYKYPPVWVTTQDLWNAMNTIDSSSGHTRGFVVVRERIQE